MTLASNALARWWLPIFVALGLVFIGLPIAAPALAVKGYDRASAVIYTAYRVTCHQLPHHSWFIGGSAATHDGASVKKYYGLDASAGDLALVHRPIRDPELGYQLAYCQRDTAIHTTLLATAILFGLAGRWRTPLRWRWYILALIPIAIDGGSGLIGLRESTPLLRTITGAIFGVATALLVLPYLEQGFRELAVGAPAVRPPVYRLLIGTHNPAKYGELSTYLALLAEEHGVGLELISPLDAGVLTAVAEDGATFEEVSASKVRAYFEASGIPSIADDGGLEIGALGGAPGVRSRRWLGDAPADDEALIRHTLDQMSGLEGELRAARLRTCISFCDGGDVAQSCDSIEGTIAREPSPRRVNGYPYRSLFWVDQLGRYYDELSAEEHALVNHRRRAVRALFAGWILPAITRRTAPPVR